MPADAAWRAEYAKANPPKAAKQLTIAEFVSMNQNHLKEVS